MWCKENILNTVWHQVLLGPLPHPFLSPVSSLFPLPPSSRDRLPVTFSIISSFHLVSVLKVMGWDENNGTCLFSEGREIQFKNELYHLIWSLRQPAIGQQASRVYLSLSFPIHSLQHCQSCLLKFKLNVIFLLKINLWLPLNAQRINHSNCYTFPPPPQLSIFTFLLPSIPWIY